MENKFTKYETARIIGARALQIAMDAPLLVKLTKEELKEMRFDALRIAEYELNEGVLPITIHRPSPRKSKDRLGAIKEEQLSDEELIAKAQEVEKEIVEDAKEIGFVNEADADEEPVEAEDDSSEEK
ncbi:DNA-directed RNA polymerase subunit K [Candidatus Pacearchaeota archaeon]|nr:DNA-directed RNA polymerase subunit K [Candidatus Pacearchaeota archaeon]